MSSLGISTKPAPSLFYFTDADELNKYFAPPWCLIYMLIYNLHTRNWARDHLSVSPAQTHAQMLRRKCSCKENMGWPPEHVHAFPTPQSLVKIAHLYSKIDRHGCGYSVASQLHSKYMERQTSLLLLLHVSLVLQISIRAEPWLKWNLDSELAFFLRSKIHWNEGDWISNASA